MKKQPFLVKVKIDENHGLCTSILQVSFVSHCALNINKEIIVTSHNLYNSGIYSHDYTNNNVA